MDESSWSSLEFHYHGERFIVRGPSLDGGLFLEKKVGDLLESKIKMKGIKNLILNILNKYNWILGEELPDDKDVIGDLTPEIIGHIYEKFVVSLEQIGLAKINPKDVQAVKGKLKLGRKKIGAYYTPEEITRYISTNTIYPYIFDKLSKKFGQNYLATWETILKKENDRKLSTLDIDIIRYLIFDVLKEIKICDNACGSGSFLIAAGEFFLLDLQTSTIDIAEKNFGDDQEISALIKDIRKSPSKEYHLVKEITTENLYGVDIAEGAVEIAKLRFWLWLISWVTKENKRIEPLPNLDFNLMKGNSLVGFVESIEKQAGDGLFIEPAKIKGQSKILQKDVQYSFGKGKTVTEILQEIGKLKRKFKVVSDPDERKNLKRQIESESEPIRRELNLKLLEKLNNRGSTISEEELYKLSPFHWSFEFFEVFDTDKPKEERGFSIIIGNPPYVKEFVNRKIFEDIKRASVSVEKYYEGKMDYLYFFIESGIDLLQESGYLSFITTNYWLQAEGAKKLRFKILTEKFSKCLKFQCNHCFRGYRAAQFYYFS